MKFPLAFNLLFLSALAAAPADYPAFHNGGPLLGVAAPIAPPPMHQRWMFRADSDPAPPPKPNDASASTVTPAYESAPAIVNGIVYAADRSARCGAIDIKTGKRLWTYRSEGGFSAGPAVVDGSVYIGDEDGIFHAVDAKTGQKRWTFDAGSGIHSSANFYKGKLVFGDDGADIYCLSADGKKLWDAKAGDRVNGSPAIGAAADGQSPSVFVSGCDSELRAIDIDTGKERYAREMGALCPGSPAVLPDRIVIGTDGGKIVCVAADGKKDLWSFEGVKNQAMVYSSPAVSDGIVVAGAQRPNHLRPRPRNRRKKVDVPHERRCRLFAGHQRWKSLRGKQRQTPLRARPEDRQQALGFRRQPADHGNRRDRRWGCSDRGCGGGTVLP